MKAELLAFVVSLLAITASHAGHGLMNSFADVEWLPDPGVTPDQITYLFDRIDESTELQFAASPDTEIALCLEFAREKLAETSAMIKALNADAASLAMQLYSDYVERVSAIIEGPQTSLTAERRHRFINALLEHVYIMSVDYLDMPLEIRTRLSPLFATAMRHYEAQSALLSKGEKDAFFFKEEEIRWSLEMTQQADKQRITNW
ncbi:MAG: DUF5667 domain-containing protein [Gammaproteobacteria bacterium]|nr:DUF5667 domain-containing protein [Gammaproteobacteria bacterium]